MKKGNNKGGANETVSWKYKIKSQRKRETPKE